MRSASLKAMPRTEKPVYGRFPRAVRLAVCLPFLVLWFAACAPPQQIRPPSELLAISVGPEDNLDELARRYLGAADRKWIIEDFNRIDALHDGQLLLIPRGNYRPGGLGPDGYQMVPVLAYPDLAAVRSEQTSRIVARFRSQMQFLQTEGYHVVDIRQLAAFMAFDATLPPKAVILTFDDQSRLFYDLIFPILRTLKLPGTLFIAPPAVGGEAQADWSQLREMTESGISIQYRFPATVAGTLKPLRFPDRSRLAQIVATLARERIQIETNIGQPCRYLAYAGGKMAALKIMLAEKAGFAGGFNRSGGSNPFYRHRFAVQREPVRWDEAIDSFRKHLDVFKDEALQ